MNMSNEDISTDVEKNDSLTDVEKKEGEETSSEHSHALINHHGNGNGSSNSHSNNGDEFLVVFTNDDPEKPLNWPFKKKAYHTALYGITTFAAQYNSSAMAPTTTHLMARFGVSETVATLATSLYVFGVAFGPMIFAPFSEVYGRKPGVLLPFFISLVFSLGSASSETYSALLCTRFFSGLFAAAPIVSSGGVLADIWTPAHRGVSLVFYAYFVVGGATYAPIIGSAVISNSETSWKWPLWVICIIYGVVLTFDVIVLTETYAPVLLARRAAKLRHSTKNWAYHAKHDEWQSTVKEFLQVHLARPFALLATPIVFLIALFASYVFGIFYIAITSISYAFQSTRGWGPVVSNLPMVALFIGMIIGGLANTYGSRRYGRLVALNNGKPLPEQRFIVMMYCGWLMPAGLFIFAWTSQKDIHWIAPMIGISIMACGFFTIFQGCLNYLVDAFTRYSASAIAANTFTRSVSGFIFI